MVNYGEVGRPKKIQGDVDASYQSQIGLEVGVGREAEKLWARGLGGKGPMRPADCAAAHNVLISQR